MKYRFTLLLFLLFSMLLEAQDVKYLQHLKNEIKQSNNDSVKVSLYLKLSNSFNVKERDSSFYYYNKSFQLAETVGLELQLADLLYTTADDFERKNSYERAISNYENALLLYQEIGDRRKVGFINNYIGFCFINLYAEDKAIEYYLKSLKICEEIGDEDGKAMNFIDIGNLYYDQGNYDNAKKYFQDALSIYEKLEDRAGIATCYTNLGNAYADDGYYEDGIDYYKQSIILEEEINDKVGIATNYNNLGDIYIQKKMYREAQGYFLKALSISNEINEKDLLAIVYLNIADVQLKIKNYKGAIKYSNISLKISREIGDLDYELDNLLRLASAHESIGNTSKALFFFKENNKVKDSLISIDKEKKVQLFNALNELEKTYFTITDLSNKNEISQLRYENEKKISYFLIVAIVIFTFLTILLIRQQASKRKAYNLLEFRNYQINKMNDEIQEQRDFLKQLNKTKDKFFSIIAHDLKNPFNSIKGFTELLIENSGEYDEEKRLKFLKVIKDSTNKASILLNNLLIWASSQSGNLDYNPKKTVLVNDVLDVVSLLEIQAIKKEIDIYNNVDHNLLVNADENMLNTVLRNLISNAIKFTKPQGEIKICSKQDRSMVEISVIDNGVGISEEEIKDLFSIDVKNTHKGTANETGSGLGLVLCKDFVEKQGGKIWVNSHLGKGTEFVFSVPLWVENSETYPVY